jgi:hypothetical protein
MGLFICVQKENGTQIDGVRMNATSFIDYFRNRKIAS